MFTIIHKTYSDKIDLMRGASLRAKTARGAVILGTGTIVDRGLRFVRNMILARILAPDEFGLMAIVMVAPMFFELFTEVGVKHSIIQNKRGSDREYLNAAWWVQVVQSSALFLIGVAMAPLISSFYDKPELLNLLRFAFLAILFRGFVSPRMSVLRKEYKFGKFVLVSQGSGIIGTFIAIGLAFMLRSVWALVIGFVAEAAVLCLLSYMFVPFLPKLSIDKESLSELLRFVLGLVGSPVLAIIALRTDVVVLGKMVSGEQLGLYGLAIYLAYLPMILADRVIRPVLLPAFSEKQDDKNSLCRGLLKISRAGAIFGAGFVALMVTCAGKILLLAYGPEYVAVAAPFAVLSICSFIRIQSGGFVAAYMAIGRPHLHRCLIALRAAIIVLLMYPAIVKFGLVGAAMAILLANIVCLFFQVRLMRKLIGLRFSEYVRCWLPGLLIFAIVSVFATLLHVFHIQSAIYNVVTVGLSCATACAIAFFCFKPNARTVRGNSSNIERLKSLSCE